jgi:hypothetical protein
MVMRCRSCTRGSFGSLVRSWVRSLNLAGSGNPDRLLLTLRERAISSPRPSGPSRKEEDRMAGFLFR